MGVYVTGTLFLVVMVAAGLLLAWRGLGLRQERVLAIGLSLAVLLFLFSVTLLIQAGLGFERAVFASPLVLVLPTLWVYFRPAQVRRGPELSKVERSGLIVSLLFVWLFTNVMQVITVDDDYWLHTPVQARMLKGEFPPSNPYFPELVLGGHFSRDLLVVSASHLTGRDIFGAQVLVTSLCHCLGLAVLYLGFRAWGTPASATAGTALIWLGMNVSGRVGLIDFFQNNGALTYLTVALMGFLISQLWREPDRRMTLLCGLLLGFFSLIYETHFGLTVLAILTLLPWLETASRRATLILVGIATTFALLGGGTLSRMVVSGQPLDQAIANQSQTVQVKFPKDPLFSLRIERREPGPVSIGYRSGLGPALLALLDRTPARVDDRYVRVWSWMVLRMHWLGVWLAPFSAWLLWRRQNRFGQFLWLFGLWGFVTPGLFDFGNIHEYEWYRWEFAAGYGFAGAAGAALGSTLGTRRAAILVGLTLLLFSEAGLRWTCRQLQYLPTVSASHLLGLEFDTEAWLLRHGQHLRFDESDLRTAAWIQANPEQGRGVLFLTTGPKRPWDVLFESTMMGLVDVQALGHGLPLDSDPIGLPPYRWSQVSQKYLKDPTLEQARRLGIDWIYLRSSDREVETRFLKSFPLLYLDGLSADGKRRLLFAVPAQEQPGEEMTLPEVPSVRLEVSELPLGSQWMGPSFADSKTGQSWSHPPVSAFTGEFWLAVPATADRLTLSVHGHRGLLQRREFAIDKLERTHP